MRTLLVALTVSLAGCADDDTVGDGGPSGTVAADPAAPAVHNLTFAPDELAGEVAFGGTFLPHENGLIEQAAGIDMNGIHDHPVDLPVGRPVFVTAEIRYEGEPGYLSVQLMAPPSTSFSYCFDCDDEPPLDEERHLLLTPGDEAFVRVRQALPANAPATDYEAVVRWVAPGASLFSGIPVEVDLAMSGATVTVEAAGALPLNPVFVYGPGGEFLARLDGERDVAFAADNETVGRHVILHSGHGVLAAFQVAAPSEPSFTLVGLRSESSGRQEVPALQPNEEFHWEHEAATAPVRVQACTMSQGFLIEPALRVDFPGGGSIERGPIQEAYFSSAGFCITTPTGDDRLYAGTYTTTYTNEGAGETWVETTFTFLDR